jgi:Rieske Fe-S protein
MPEVLTKKFSTDIKKTPGRQSFWDCPFHRSRFTCDGKVLKAPASENLFYYLEKNPEFLELLKQD